MALMRLRWVLVAIGLSAANPAMAADVIAHAGYPETSIARSLLRGVFGMRVRAWPDGTPVRVFVLADGHPTHEDFCKTVLQFYPYQLRQDWDRLLYSGTGQQPVTVVSEEELLRRVAETPGGIGYLGTYRPPQGSRSVNVKVLHVR